jgi:two-component system response regulator
MNLINTDILLVEDNITDAELTMRALKKQPMPISLFHVKNGEEALDFIFGTGPFADSRSVDHPPRLILLDIQTPKVSGIEVLQRIKADERTKRIPVVMLTSSRESPDIRKCYTYGVNSYIVKPLNFTAFADAVSSLGLYWLLQNQPPV